VSVQVEGTASPAQNMPEELKKYFGDNAAGAGAAF
jgi:serine protease DegQ